MRCSHLSCQCHSNKAKFDEPSGGDVELNLLVGGCLIKSLPKLLILNLLFSTRAHYLAYLYGQSPDTT